MDSYGKTEITQMKTLKAECGLNSIEIVPHLCPDIEGPDGLVITTVLFALIIIALLAYIYYEKKCK